MEVLIGIVRCNIGPGLEVTLPWLKRYNFRVFGEYVWDVRQGVSADNQIFPGKSTSWVVGLQFLMS